MSKKRRNALPEILFHSATILLYLIIVGTLQIYAGKTRESSQFKTEQFAERILTDFSINYFLKRISDYGWLNDDVKGVAIYSEQGERLVSYGEVPDTLEDFVLEDRMTREYDREARTLTYIRAIPQLDIKNTQFFSFQEEKPPKMTFTLALPESLLGRFEILNTAEDEDNWIILYLRMADFWYKQDNQVRMNVIILAYCVPLILGAFILSSSLIFHRFMKSQRQLNEQKNLVLLGTAVRTISHEMKNPLATIFLQLPLINRITGGTVERETGIISSEVERLNALITWISDFLKEPEGVIRELDLTEETARARERFPAELNWFLPDEPLRVAMDPERFRTVLDNLINNALESGSPPARIGISLGKGIQEVFLSVTDRGKGISEEEKRKIFDPFYTSKSRGSGVGLAVTRRFVEGVGGQIRLHSEVGMGTEITVILKRIK